ncbi:hypothetical protein [Streptomyces sp. NPDC059564]|uniref:hypothetical protein n=1 Tax=Streptomyces sp. NPDC059564 TaxID=3346865 RepID=UPI00368C38EF
MDVAALVTAGATTVVGLMASDAWTYASGRFARLLGRGSDGADGEPAANEAATALELRASRAELLMARADGDEAAAAQVEETWRERLRAVLQRDESAARELAELLDDVNPGWRQPAGTVINNTINGGTYYDPVIQSGGISNFTLNQGPKPPQAPPTPPA